MNRRNHQFIDAVNVYPDFKEQFRQFCDKCLAPLNDKEHVPGVSFNVGSDGITAELRALDRLFEISFDFVVLEGSSFGVLRISLPATPTSDVILLWHTLFDRLGNVKDSPTAHTAPHSLISKDFLEKFLAELASNYFLHISRTLM
jgi:hypothetical protein